MITHGYVCPFERTERNNLRYRPVTYLQNSTCTVMSSSSVVAGSRCEYTEYSNTTAVRGVEVGRHGNQRCVFFFSGKERKLNARLNHTTVLRNCRHVAVAMVSLFAHG